jgi:hypothetical protein
MKLRGPFNKEYLDVLRSDDVIVRIADLLEEIEKASILGLQGNQFSEVATSCILEKLYAIKYPGWEIKDKLLKKKNSVEL